MAFYVQTCAAAFACFIFTKLLFTLFITPLRALHKLRSHGFSGPNPAFPFGNLDEMKRKTKETKADLSRTSPSPITHDVHPTSLPYFSDWQKTYGKVFVYWMGTEPFLYVADPEFLKEMAGEVAAKNWGKPAVFQRDRAALFGKFGLNVTYGSDWVRHRHIITPAFSSATLKVMTSPMVECTTKLMSQWRDLMTTSSSVEIDIENEISSLAGKIIAKTNFGLDSEAGETLYNKLRTMQMTLFKHTRYVGVPFGHLLSIKHTLEATRLGNEVDELLLNIINSRRKLIGIMPQHDLLGILLEEAEANKNKYATSLTTQELVDECKTFFFGGHETVALAMTWTLMLLALNPKWQEELREEIKAVIGNGEIDFTMLAGLKKMSWVMNEVLRLYPSSPNVQRQATSDIRVGDTVIPKGTNIWIDVVGMNHDRSLWGDDVNEFRPERFQEDPLYGGCALKMGYVPFGFGGRMCIGRNYAFMEYKIVMSLILSRFSFKVSPSYEHSPTYCFSFRPGCGVPLIVQDLATA